MLASKIRVGMCLPDDLDPEVLQMITARTVSDLGFIHLHLGANTYVAVDPTDEVEVRNCSGEEL